MLHVPENQINIRGNIFKKISENYYLYNNKDTELLAYEFKPCKEEFPDIINIDACSIFYIENKYYIVYGRNIKNKQRFCP